MRASVLRIGPRASRDVADYRAVMRRHPPVRDYIRRREWVRRGGVVAYGPRLEAGVFSTDAFGQRHTVWRGRRLGLSHAMSGEPYGVVLGASHAFGFGLPGDEATIASRLSERLGEAHVTIAFPEADMRDLETALRRVLREAPRPPSRIVLFAGGTLTRYAYVRRCDPLFGIPDFEGRDGPGPIEPGTQAEAAQFASLLRCFAFWLSAMTDEARRAGSTLLLQEETTALEKRTLTETERACRLGEAHSESARKRFETQRLHHAAFHAAGTDAARRLALVPARPTDPDTLTFIDEFHYDVAGTERLVEAVERHAAAAEQGVEAKERA